MSKSWEDADCTRAPHCGAPDRKRAKRLGGLKPDLGGNARHSRPFLFCRDSGKNASAYLAPSELAGASGTAEGAGAAPFEGRMEPPGLLKLPVGSYISMHVKIST